MISIAAKSPRACLLAGLFGLGIAGFTGPAVSDAAGDDPGEQSTPAAEAGPAVRQLQAKRREIRQVTRELREIQRNATRANPDLEAEQKGFRDLVVSTMETEDYDPEAEVERIRELQAALQSGGSALSEKERQSKSRELQQKAQQFRRRQRQAMQDDVVQAAQRELDDKLRSAMKTHNPKAGELIAELDELRQEYQALLERAVEQQQGTGDAPQG